MSLQLTESRGQEDLYSIVVHVVGAVPVLLFTSYFSSGSSVPAVPLLLTVSSFLLLAAVFFMDLKQKMDYPVFFFLSALSHLLSLLLTLALTFLPLQSLIYSAALASTLMSLFLLHPVSISEEKLKVVKTRFGTAGFQDAIILRDVDFKNPVTSPLDLGIVGVDNFSRYFFGDYYSLRQSSHPPIVFAVVVSSLLQILLQKYPPTVAILQFDLMFVGCFILGYMVKMWMATMYSEDDLVKEVQYRLEFKFSKKDVPRLKRLMLVSVVVSLILLGPSLVISPVPSGRARLVNLLEPSSDFLLPLSLFMVYLALYIHRQVWKAGIWSKLRPVKKRKR